MRIRKKTTAAAMLVTGLMTIGTGYVLESSASAAGVLDRTDKELFLKESQQGSAWADFVGDEEECDDAATPAGFDYLWHFVVPDFPGGPNGGEPDVTAIQTAFAAGIGNINAGNVVQDGKGWNVYTENAGTLLDATGDSTSPGASLTEMNLSHTCGPEQTTTTNTETTNTETTNTATTNTATTNTATTNTATTNTATTATSTTDTATTATATAAILGTEVSNDPSSNVSVSGIVLTAGANTLPRTGFDPGLLLMVGGMLVLGGVLMMRYSDDTA